MEELGELLVEGCYKDKDLFCTNNVGVLGFGPWR